MGRRSAWSSTRLCVVSAACSSCAYPDVPEHNKTPAGAFCALTGVISSENGQAVFPSREGKLHCQGLLMQFRCGAQLKLMLEKDFFRRPVIELSLALSFRTLRVIGRTALERCLASAFAKPAARIALGSVPAAAGCSAGRDRILAIRRSRSRQACPDQGRKCTVGSGNVFAARGDARPPHQGHLDRAWAAAGTCFAPQAWRRRKRGSAPRVPSSADAGVRVCIGRLISPTRRRVPRQLR
jgi:hypothetical protein